MEITKTVNDDLSSLTKKTADDGSLWECELSPTNPETQKKFSSKEEVEAFIDSRVTQPNYWRIAYATDEAKKAAEKPMYEETVRAERNYLLAKYDWTSTSSDLSDDKKAEWKTYREALRDLPDQSGFPYTHTWPTKPTT